MRDASIGGMSPRAVLAQFRQLMPKGIPADTFLSNIGFADIMSVSPQVEYQHMGVSEKIKVSALARVNAALRGQSDRSRLTPQQLGSAFQGALVESGKVVTEAFNSALGGSVREGVWRGKRASEFGLGSTDAQILDTYNDIVGNGFLRVSDQTASTAITVGKVGVMIATSIGTAVVIGATLPLTGTALAVSSAVGAGVVATGVGAVVE